MDPQSAEQIGYLWAHSDRCPPLAPWTTCTDSLRYWTCRSHLGRVSLMCLSTRYYSSEGQRCLSSIGVCHQAVNWFDAPFSTIHDPRWYSSSDLDPRYNPCSSFWGIVQRSALTGHLRYHLDCHLIHCLFGYHLYHYIVGSKLRVLDFLAVE